MSGMDLNSLGLLLSTRQESSVINFVAWIAIGLVTGFMASKTLNKTRYGLGRDILLSVVGAIVGGFLSNLFGRPAKGLDLYSLIVAAVGAIVFLIVYHALFRRRRFLTMR